MLSEKDTKRQKYKTIQIISYSLSKALLEHHNRHMDKHHTQTHTHTDIHKALIDSDKYSISPSLCGFGVQHCDWRQIGFSALLLSIKYDISYWKKNESVQTSCPQRCRWTDCLIQCGCLTKDAHMGALVDLHHKNTWQKKKKSQICLWGVCKETGVSKERLTYTGNLIPTNTHSPHTLPCLLNLYASGATIKRR